MLHPTPDSRPGLFRFRRFAASPETYCSTLTPADCGLRSKETLQILVQPHAASDGRGAARLEPYSLV